MYGPILSLGFCRVMPEIKFNFIIINTVPPGNKNERNITENKSGVLSRNRSTPNI